MSLCCLHRLTDHFSEQKTKENVARIGGELSSVTMRLHRLRPHCSERSNVPQLKLHISSHAASDPALHRPQLVWNYGSELSRVWLHRLTDHFLLKQKTVVACIDGDLRSANISNVVLDRVAYCIFASHGKRKRYHCSHCTCTRQPVPLHPKRTHSPCEPLSTCRSEDAEGTHRLWRYS